MSLNMNRHATRLKASKNLRINVATDDWKILYGLFRSKGIGKLPAQFLREFE